MTKKTTDQVAAEQAVEWLNNNKERIHAKDCVYHEPSARCSCGFHNVMTLLHAIKNDNTHYFVTEKEQ